jgi:hypothetical protein
MISFTKYECEQIINLSKILPKVERDESPRPISYDFYSIGWNDETKWIFDRMDSYFTETTGIKVLKSLDAIHLFDYSVGDKFGRHRDTYYTGQVWNIGVCLNDDYEGGDFVLYNPNKTIPKIQGEIYTFECKHEHEVLEVTKGNRWSLIGFYFYEHLNLKPSLL